jgi:hypothetical protein
LSNPNESSTEAAATASLVIMAANANSVKGTIAFLARRGVNTKFVQNINDAIEIFAKKEATMLLLSMNTPHPKVDLLPQLMQQSFQITTIAFAEQSDRKTSTRLQNAKTKHVLYGPVSGPVILMKMRQIEKELAGVEASASENNSSGERNSNERENSTAGIKVGGGNDDTNDNSIVLKGAKGGSIQEKIAAAMKALNSDSAGADGKSNSAVGKGTDDREVGSLARSGGVIVQKGSTGELKNASQGGENSKPSLSQAVAEALRKGMMSMQEGADPSKASEAYGGKNGKENSAALQGSQSENHQAKNSQKNGERKSPKIHDAIPEDEKRKREIELARAAKGNEHRNSIQLSANEIIMRECVQKALVEVCGSKSVDANDLADCQFAMLVTIDSLSLKGAVLMVVGHSLRPSKELVEKVKSVFFSFLKIRGFIVSEEDCASIELDHLKLVHATLRRSTQTFFRAAEGIEMAAMIVPNLYRVADVETREDQMAMIRLKDLVAQVPLNFEVFLHLPVNKKYIRYLKTGSHLEENQAGRLERSQVTHLFLNQDDSEACRKYFAINTIMAKSA